MNFVALDFETANADLSSICQVGAVTFGNGEVAKTFSTLVNPLDHFDRMNVAIHGIDEEKVRGAPLFSDIFLQLAAMLTDAVVVCHSHFDRAALRQASVRHKLSDITCSWLDTTRVVRRTWPQYAKSGYGLRNVTQDFGITFNHHDAAEDARATGLILMRALRETGQSLDDWIVRSQTPIAARSSVSREGDADGPLQGEIAVFTGALAMSRSGAADLAARAGCEVATSVTKSTTLLIVGDQDVTKLSPGQSKSSKHLKAEALMAKGQTIRILRESDFLQFLAI